MSHRPQSTATLDSTAANSSRLPFGQVVTTSTYLPTEKCSGPLDELVRFLRSFGAADMWDGPVRETAPATWLLTASIRGRDGHQTSLGSVSFLLVLLQSASHECMIRMAWKGATMLSTRHQAGGACAEGDPDARRADNHLESYTGIAFVTGKLRAGKRVRRG